MGFGGVKSEVFLLIFRFFCNFAIADGVCCSL